MVSFLECVSRTAGAHPWAPCQSHRPGRKPPERFAEIFQAVASSRVERGAGTGRDVHARAPDGGQREDRFRFRGHNARAIDPQAFGRFQEPELDRVPIKSREIGKAPEREGAQPTLPIGLHVIGEDRIGQHGHMAEDIMKYVW